MAGIRIVGNMNLDDIDDEETLKEMLDHFEDFQIRKLVRARLKEVRDANRVQREERFEKLTNTREEMIQKRAKEAKEQKERTLKMYDQMAKSAPAGGDKVMNIGIYKDGESASPVQTIQKRDLVEEAIKERNKQNELRKNRILVAFDVAAKSSPAGAPKDVDFENIRKEDVIGFVPDKPTGYSTFEMSDGVPKLAKAPSSQPGTPLSPATVSAPSLQRKDTHMDVMEASIRARQREADENKRKTLAAYDALAKGPAGPKTLGVSEMRKGNGAEIARKTETVTSTSFKTTGSNVVRSPSDIKEMLLNWCRAKTKNYSGINITNFSSSWSDGMAFCALIHSYFTDAFDYETLDGKNRRKNFELAFKVAEEKADIAPLLDIDDMILMKNKPDWKCVFTYVQSMYRTLRNYE